MALITRQEKGSKLSILEMDNNLLYLEGLAQSAGYTYLEIDLSSTDILNLNAEGIALLPQPGENKYYTWYGTVEFFPGTTSYSVSGPLNIIMDKVSYAIDGSLLTELVTAINPFSIFLDGVGFFQPNTEVRLIYAGVSAITKGNGTLKIKLNYKINQI